MKNINSIIGKFNKNNPYSVDIYKKNGRIFDIIVNNSALVNYRIVEIEKD